jgi:hypothetical protein
MTTEQLFIAGISGCIAALGAVVAALKVLWRAYQERVKAQDTVMAKTADSNYALKGSVDILIAELRK